MLLFFKIINYIVLIILVALILLIFFNVYVKAYVFFKKKKFYKKRESLIKEYERLTCVKNKKIVSRYKMLPIFCKLMHAFNIDDDKMFYMPYGYTFYGYIFSKKIINSLIFELEDYVNNTDLHLFLMDIRNNPYDNDNILKVLKNNINKIDELLSQESYEYIN